MPDAPPTHLEIAEWRTHQHYGKRRPPWIKVYAKMLHNPRFLALPEAAQAQLIKLWVLASQMGHPLPNNPKMLAGHITVLGRFYLPEIITAGFVIPCYQDASNPLAEREQNASTLVQSTERETTTTHRPAWQPAREAFVAERLVSDAGRVALASILARYGDKSGVVGEVVACVEGVRGQQFKATWAQIDLALCDYAAKYLTDKPWEPTLFRGCIRRAMRPEAEVVPIRRGGVGQRSYDNAVEALKDLPEPA